MSSGFILEVWLVESPALLDCLLFADRLRSVSVGARGCLADRRPGVDEGRGGLQSFALLIPSVYEPTEIDSPSEIRQTGNICGTDMRGGLCCFL